MTKAVVARIERVTHRYGKTFALNDVTLDIPAHCMVGLIGPDGVGKSTLLALIAGVRKIQTGKVTVLDGDMAEEQPSRGRATAASPTCRRASAAISIRRSASSTTSTSSAGLFGQGAAERHARIDELLKATGPRPVSAIARAASSQAA